MKPTFFQSRITLFLSFFLLLVLLCSCSNGCAENELSPYLDQVDQLSSTFTDLTNETANHPELKADNVANMKVMLDDFSATDYPRCARNLSKLVQEAMSSSITYLAPSDHTYYYPYQLAKFAMDDWQEVSNEIAVLKASFSE